MEAAPPSYESATLIDHLDLIAQYLPSRDLCAAALVCSKWHATFAPHIWGNPASHFGIENDAVYVALTRFKKTLQTARLFVRSQTHTLHFPPAHAEIYYGPHSDWLRDLLERLPNLQSLIVRGLPFFDYAALQALSFIRNKPEEHRHAPSGVVELPGSAGSFFQSPTTLIPSFGLRLLDASRCPNVTSSGLASALARFEGLMYLDLSFSYPAREDVVLNTLRKFTGLQVLKLRGVSLKDENVHTLSGAIGLRVRSLDLRDNYITDRGIRTLLDHCFLMPSNPVNPVLGSAHGPRSPTLLPYLGAEMLDIYRGEDFEGYLRNAFTGRFVSRLAIEDAPSGGITHLYIAGNLITVEAVSGLIRSERLHVLDVGSLAPSLQRHPSGSSGNLSMPGAEKLTPVLREHGGESVTFLRIDHTLITKEAPNLHPEEIVHGRVELGDTSLPSCSGALELDATTVRPETFEMPTDEQTPRFELEADPMQFVVSSPRDDTYQIDVPGQNGDGPRRGSAFAPEVVDTLASEMDRKTHLSPVSALEDGTMTTASGFPSLISPFPQDTPVGSAPSTPKPRPRSYSSMATERKARLNAHVLAGHNLHPAMLPHISTLVLTNVPPFSTNRDVANRIICFIKNCAEETTLAQSQAELDYSLPPGRRDHATALKYSAKKIFALKRIVLEMGAESDRRNSKASPWQHQDTRSMTEDRDSEALWNAAETDFSFFGEEEVVFPTIQSGRFAFQSDDKEVSFGQPVMQNEPAKPAVKPRIDNIALLSAFRKERKLAYQRNVNAGNPEAETEGYWGGVVQVVRSNNMRSDEDTDYYGNMFTNNYLYR
ncbi:hypothetical protein M409DRAFT_70339 [Zasmidium cellare ATCC 36951]|uniref:F-box domain-containing protein n=1 Tax=Zasmidium cellare ATCC 36951 TaxID=1080233 RepID=A0A6A6C5D7_ZASCE|nr:uncharacterized protein M409DRAFT_70339 [Zasmidium cellare ATCC 36951]KAF2160596.1 hypothetical protein M409DRAFT_70339 [Zasmidium cellare ATCC 36951]